MNLRERFINKIRGVYYHLESRKKDRDFMRNYDYEIINGTKFYYRPDELELTKEIISELSECVEEEDDDSFILYEDETQGIVFI